MALVVASIVSAASAAASAGTQISAAKKAEKAAKKGTKGTNTPTFTPIGSALQEQLLGMLMSRMGRPPQSPADYMARGPQASMDLSTIPFHQRQALGMGSGLPQVIPSGVSPELIAALERLNITQPGSIRAPAPQVQPGGARPNPPKIPLTGAFGRGTNRY